MRTHTHTPITPTFPALEPAHQHKKKSNWLGTGKNGKRVAKKAKAALMLLPQIS